MNKEREDFEAEFSKIKSDIAFWLHTWDEEMQGYNHPVMCWFWYMWQAAKAQAVPEGYVLVPMMPSERMINAVRQCYEGEAYLPYSLYSEFVNQAIIERMEAQEPVND